MVSDRAVGCVAFDVNETLFSLERLGPAFAEVGLDPALVPLWFARLLRDGFALAAMEQSARFADLAADALRGLAPATVDDRAVGQVLGAFRQLDPHPDVAGAFEVLEEAGVPAVTLTNGSTEVVEALLERAGLSPHVRQCLSADEVGRWKPASPPYRYAAAQLDLEPARLALVASHPWDCAGAHAAGLPTGWINRTGAPWPQVFPPPDVTAADLSSVVAGLLDLEP